MTIYVRVRSIPTPSGSVVRYGSCSEATGTNIGRIFAPSRTLPPVILIFDHVSHLTSTVTHRKPCDVLVKLICWMDYPSIGRVMERGSPAMLLVVMICLCVAFVVPQVRVCTALGSAFKLVDVLLNYGNGTRRWTSCILYMGNDTVYNATRQVVSSLEVSWYDGMAFVDAIDDVWNSHPYYWIWWYWNSSAGCWELGPVACNQYVLEDCCLVAWYYEDCSTWPPSPPPEPPVTRIDVLLDYGNNTRVWLENVEVLGFASVLKVTKAVAFVEYSLWDTDIFVDAINNVWNDYTSFVYFWIYWLWNHSAKCWEMGPVACNKYVLVDGDILAWYYEDCTTWPLAPPTVTPHPTVSFTWTPLIPKVGQSVTFDASASKPNGGTIVDYAWDFGDGRIAHGKIVIHIYNSPGKYKVTLNVTDSNGLWSVEQRQITVVQPHGPKADFKAVPETARVGEKIKFDASASQPGWNGTHSMPITEYRWNFGDGNITVTNKPIVYHSYSAPGNYYVTVTVHAPGAAPETDSKTVRVTVFSVPVGGQSVSTEKPSMGRELAVYLTSITAVAFAFAAFRRKTVRRR